MYLYMRPNKKNHMFRVTLPYLDLLVKPFFSGFLGKKINFIHFERQNIISCILKGQMPFKMHEIYFLIQEKNMCAYPTYYLDLRIFSTVTRNTHIYFIWPEPKVLVPEILDIDEMIFFSTQPMHGYLPYCKLSWDTSTRGRCWNLRRISWRFLLNYGVSY